LLSCSGRPNSSISTHTARTAQPPNAINRGSTPNRPPLLRPAPRRRAVARGRPPERASSPGPRRRH
jgi:hypothetical protein